MKKISLALAVPLAAAALLAQAPAQAQSWRFMPAFTDASFQLRPTLAFTTGYVNPDAAPSATFWGLEANFNSGVIQSPDNRIRTYLQANFSDKSGVKATVFELSPRYMLPLDGSFSVGLGPSLTNATVKGGGASNSVWGLGVAGGLDWRLGSLYAGIDLRWHETARKNGVTYDNTALGFKVGLNF